MEHEANPEPTIPQAPKIDVEEGQLDSNLEAAIERGVISRAEALRFSGKTVVSRVFEFSPEAEAEAEAAEPPYRPKIEAVTHAHKPQPGAKREAKLRKSPKPRNWRERMAADQPPESQRVTPLGHDYLPTVVDGGKADRR